MHDMFEDNIDEVSILDLIKGYYIKEECYNCLFCNEKFKLEQIYKIDEDLVTAKKAMENHLELEHGGVFNSLLNLDKILTGLTDRQKEVFENIFHYQDNKIVAKNLEMSPATIRSYKYKKMEKIRQSKIFLAITYLMDYEEAENNIKDIEQLIYEDKDQLRMLDNILGRKNLDFKIKE